MQLDRLLAITLELMTKKRVRASELAKRLEVSTRTIYRAIDLINQAGIPVVSYTGADGGFELMDGFHLTRQHFSVEDFTMIYQMLQSLEQEVGGGMTNVKHKLASLHPNLANKDRSHKVLIDLSTTAEERSSVRTILEATDQLRTIGFTYQKAYDSLQGREVEPGKLFWERGAWYLEGYCLNKEAKRTFRVSRMSNLKMLERTFQPRHNHTDTGEQTPSGFHAHLRFLPSAAPRVTEQFKEECRQIDDQGYEVQTVFYDMQYAVSVALSYGAKVTVLSPPELKDALLSTIREIEQIYV